MKLSESIVLIVDDDEEIGIQAKRILENLGTQVLVAYDVSSALKILETKAPHLIVTDLEMKPVGGFEFLKKLRGDKLKSTIPTVVLSALSNKNSVYQAIALGALDYIVKPLKASQFVRKIRRVLKDQEFLKYDFAPGEASQITTSVSGVLQSVGDIGLRIESNANFNVCKNVSLKETRPEVVNMDKLKFSIHGKSQRSLKGMYLSELIAIPTGFDFIEIKKGLTQ